MWRRADSVRSAPTFSAVLARPTGGLGDRGTVSTAGACVLADGLAEAGIAGRGVRATCQRPVHRSCGVGAFTVVRGGLPGGLLVELFLWVRCLLWNVAGVIYLGARRSLVIATGDIPVVVLTLLREGFVTDGVGSRLGLEGLGCGVGERCSTTEQCDRGSRGHDARGEVGTDVPHGCSPDVATVWLHVALSPFQSSSLDVALQAAPGSLDVLLCCSTGCACSSSHDSLRLASRRAASERRVVSRALVVSNWLVLACPHCHSRVRFAG